MKAIILMERNMNNKIRQSKKFRKSIKYDNFRHATLTATFGHKIDEFSLIYCQDWFAEPSPEYYGEGDIVWNKIPRKYFKVPKKTEFTYWIGWITFKDTNKWLELGDNDNGSEKWIWREGDRPTLNNDTTMEFIEIDA